MPGPSWTASSSVGTGTSDTWATRRRWWTSSSGSSGPATWCSRWEPATSARSATRCESAWPRAPPSPPTTGAQKETGMLGEIRGEVRFKEPLAFHTSLRCGGPADIFVLPQDVDDVRKTLMFADKEKLPVALLGSGHNTLVRDRGYRGIVLKIE